MVGKERNLAIKVFPRLLTTDAQDWMFHTTLDNLESILKQQVDEDYKGFMQKCIDEITKQIKA